MKTTFTNLLLIALFASSTTNLFAQLNPAGCSRWVDVYTSGTVYTVNAPIYDTTYVIAFPWDTVTIRGSWGGGCFGGNSGSLYHINTGTHVSMNAPCLFPITISGEYIFVYEYPIPHIINVQFVQPTGLEEQVSDQILLYPNPVIDNLFVRCNFEEYDISVIDVNGRIIKRFVDNHGNTTFQTSNLPGGVYQVVIKNENVVQSRSIIKL